MTTDQHLKPVTALSEALILSRVGMKMRSQYNTGPLFTVEQWEAWGESGCPDLYIYEASAT
jgi:hypothetical protein